MTWILTSYAMQLLTNASTVVTQLPAYTTIFTIWCIWPLTRQLAWHVTFCIQATSSQIIIWILAGKKAKQSSNTIHWRSFGHPSYHGATPDIYAG